MTSNAVFKLRWRVLKSTWSLALGGGWVGWNCAVCRSIVTTSDCGGLMGTPASPTDLWWFALTGRLTPAAAAACSGPFHRWTDTTSAGSRICTLTHKIWDDEVYFTTTSLWGSRHIFAPLKSNSKNYDCLGNRFSWKSYWSKSHQTVRDKTTFTRK